MVKAWSGNIALSRNACGHRNDDDVDEPVEDVNPGDGTDTDVDVDTDDGTDKDVDDGSEG